MTLKVAAAAPRARPDRHDFESGATYIRALHDATRSAEVDPEFRLAVDGTLAPLAIKHRWSNRDAASLEFALDGGKVPYLLTAPLAPELLTSLDRLA